MAFWLVGMRSLALAFLNLNGTCMVCGMYWLEMEVPAWSTYAHWCTSTTKHQEVHSSLVYVVEARLVFKSSTPYGFEAYPGGQTRNSSCK